MLGELDWLVKLVIILGVAGNLVTRDLGTHSAPVVLCWQPCSPKAHSYQPIQKAWVGMDRLKKRRPLRRGGDSQGLWWRPSVPVASGCPSLMQSTVLEHSRCWGRR